MNLIITLSIGFSMVTAQWTTNPTNITTADIEYPNVVPSSYWGAYSIKISPNHNFHPESATVQLPAPSIGCACWYAATGAGGFNPIGVAFTSAIINESTLEIYHESPLSDMQYKCFSGYYSGWFHDPFMNVLLVNHSLVNGYVAYMINWHDRTQWKRIEVRRKDQTTASSQGDGIPNNDVSFIVRTNTFDSTPGELITVTTTRSPTAIPSQATLDPSVSPTFGTLDPTQSPIPTMNPSPAPSKSPIKPLLVINPTRPPTETHVTTDTVFSTMKTSTFDLFEEETDESAFFLDELTLIMGAIIIVLLVLIVGGCCAYVALFKRLKQKQADEDGIAENNPTETSRQKQTETSRQNAAVEDNNVVELEETKANDSMDDDGDDEDDESDASIDDMYVSKEGAAETTSTKQ